MKRYRDNSVRSIPWWAAALANVQDLKKHEKEFQDVEAYLENLATEHNMSEAELNAFMWFSLDDYLIENNYMDSKGVWLD